ncbi:unannotated protein [freshwater metagenome]|uniref:Unannotated protein n=1 Tax=freshwater metagenome TaxID=449393 RepID=A0A6J7GMZ6_9ZZZZ
MMQRKNCREIRDFRFSRQIPFANNGALRTQNVKLWLTCGSKIGVNKCGLGSIHKSNSDVRMISVRHKIPVPLVIDPRNVSNSGRQDREQLVYEVAAPVENSAARDFCIRVPMPARLGVATNEGFIVENFADHTRLDECRHRHIVRIKPAVLVHD